MDWKPGVVPLLSTIFQLRSIFPPLPSLALSWAALLCSPLYEVRLMASAEVPLRAQGW